MASDWNRYCVEKILGCKISNDINVTANTVKKLYKYIEKEKTLIKDNCIYFSLSKRARLFCLMCEEGDLEMVKIYNDWSEFGRYPFMIAVSRGDVELVKYLATIDNLDVRINYEDLSDDELDAVNIAIKKNSLEMVKYLYYSGIESQTKHYMKKRVEMWIIKAAEYGSIDIFKFFVKEVGDFNVNCLLENLVRLGCTEGLLFIINEVGYIVDKEGKSKNIASNMLSLILNGDLAAFNKLKVKYMSCYYKFANEFLYFACLCGNMSFISSFINDNSYASLMTEYLYPICMSGTVKVFEFLEIEIGLRYMNRCFTRINLDFVLIAVRSGSIELIDYLLSDKFSLEIRSENIPKALPCAVQTNKISVIEYVINKSWICSSSTHEALIEAIRSGSLDLVKYLTNKKIQNMFSRPDLIIEAAIEAECKPILDYILSQPEMRLYPPTLLDIGDIISHNARHFRFER